MIKEKRKRQNRINRREVSTQGQDLEKLYKRDIDDFLEDSEWDIESIDVHSSFSGRTNKTAGGENKLRDLESIYLQRIDTTMAKKHKAAHRKKKEKAPKFRVMQDRFLDEPEMLKDDLGNESDPSYLSEQKRFAPLSARGGNPEVSPHQPNLFHGHLSLYKKEDSPTLDRKQNL